MQDKRERYLSLMGIDTYQLRQPEETPADVVMASETQAITHENETVHQATDKNESTIVEHTEKPIVIEKPAADETTRVNHAVGSESFRGLRYITKAPENGLVVVLPSLSKDLEPASRQLMSKMLNSIHCKPSQTGFAESGAETESDSIPTEGIQVILFLDYQAGKQFIDQNNALRVPGADYCDLNGVAIVISIHPQILLTTPDLKATSWRDLKLIANLLQDK